MAAYRSSSVGASSSSVGQGVARGGRGEPPAVASFEPGSSTRATIIATTRSRRASVAAMSRSRRSCRSVPSTAATWPCGNGRCRRRGASRRRRPEQDAQALHQGGGPLLARCASRARTARGVLGTACMATHTIQCKSTTMRTYTIYMATSSRPDGHQPTSTRNQGEVRVSTASTSRATSPWHQLSGYRNQETHQLVITTEYDSQEDDFRIVSLLEK